MLQFCVPPGQTFSEISAGRPMQARVEAEEEEELCILEKNVGHVCTNVLLVGREADCAAQIAATGGPINQMKI
jgi:hypothetical protein